jgi:hypothetical protein
MRPNNDECSVLVQSNDDYCKFLTDFRDVQKKRKKNLNCENFDRFVWDSVFDLEIKGIFVNAGLIFRICEFFGSFC